MSSNIYPVQCTAGAIPYRNEKGEISMKNVKVSRYVAGKAPEFFSTEIEEIEDDDYEDDVELIKDAFPDRSLVSTKKGDNAEIDEDNEAEEEMNERDMEDPRIQRLLKGHKRNEIEMLEDSDSEKEEDKVTRHLRERQNDQQKEGEGSDEEEDNEEDEEEFQQRRNILRMRALANEIDEVPEFVDFDDEEEEVAFSEEEESESDNEREPKLKPVFVPASARQAVHKTKEQIQKEIEKERNRAKHQDEIVKQTRKMIEKINKEEAEEGRSMDQAHNAISSDAENESEEYEMWKRRQLNRLKRNRDENEALRRDKDEVAKIRNMTEDQRLHEFKVNPKKIVNQQPKGKLKYMQKYYHRGGYFVQDMEDEVFKRDFTAPTLEDNFNVQNLPLVKQVKNFGRAGRTKYTHLVDQDTTDFESGWANSNSTLKFYNSKGGGMKQIFEKPSAPKRLKK